MAFLFAFYFDEFGFSLVIQRFRLLTGDRQYRSISVPLKSDI